MDRPGQLSAVVWISTTLVTLRRSLFDPAWCRRKNWIDYNVNRAKFRAVSFIRGTRVVKSVYGVTFLLGDFPRT